MIPVRDVRNFIFLIYIAATLLRASASDAGLKWDSLHADLTIEANEPSIKYMFHFINDGPGALNITNAAPECHACSSIYLEKTRFEAGEKGFVEVSLANPGALDTMDRGFSVQTDTGQIYILRVHLAVTHVIDAGTGYLLWNAKENGDKSIEIKISEQYGDPTFKTASNEFEIKKVDNYQPWRWRITLSPSPKRTEALLDGLVIRCNNIERKILLCALN